MIVLWPTIPNIWTLLWYHSVRHPTIDSAPSKTSTTDHPHDTTREFSLCHLIKSRKLLKRLCYASNQHIIFRVFYIPWLITPMSSLFDESWYFSFYVPFFLVQLLHVITWEGSQPIPLFSYVKINPWFPCMFNLWIAESVCCGTLSYPILPHTSIRWGGWLFNYNPFSLYDFSQN